MLLSEAKKLLEENGYIVELPEINEGKLGRTLAAGALTLGLATGNANAVSDNDVINFEKNKKEQIEKPAKLTRPASYKSQKPTFYKNENGDYVHENITANYTEYTIFYKDKTFKQIIKPRNKPETINYGIYKNLNDVFYGPSGRDNKINKHLQGLITNKTVLMKNNGKIDKIIKYTKNDMLIIDDKSTDRTTNFYFDWEYDSKKDTWIKKFW